MFIFYQQEDREKEQQEEEDGGEQAVEVDDMKDLHGGAYALFAVPPAAVPAIMP
jgi:hypothetical protein